MAPLRTLWTERPAALPLLLALVVLAGLLATAALNLAVDPYDLWQLTDTTRPKPAVEGHDRMHQATLIRSAAPDTLLAGTSRAQVMLDPASPSLAGRRAVNIGINGGHPYEVRRMLQHAQAVGEVTLLIYGVDLLAFDATGKINAEMSEDRFLVDADGRAHPGAWLADVPAAVLSWDAVVASISTLRHPERPGYLLQNGQRDPRFQEASIARAGSQHALFVASERDYLELYACWTFGEPPRTTPFQELERIFALMGRQTVRLYLSPVHERHAQVMAATGLAETDLTFRAVLVQLVQRARAQGLDVELWDFSGAESAEPLPADPRSEAPLTWWWESSHARAELGERVLAELLGTRPPTLGVRLEPGNLGAEQAKIRARRADWQQGHPQEVEEIQRLADEMVPRARASRECRTISHP